jgi:hypothetical protein
MVALSRSRLLNVVSAAANGSPAAQECREALLKSGFLVFDAKTVDRSELRRIYRIRLSRRHPKPPKTLGSERILSDLAAYTGDILAMVALELDGKVYCMLLDASGSRLVTCFVARDRRDIRLPMDVP